MRFSPLFWPVKLQGKTILILDETALPQKIVYLSSHGYPDSCAAIKNMKTRAVGQVLLVMYTFLLEIEKHRNAKTLVSHLEKVARSLNATRPTLSFKMLTDMVLGWARSGAPLAPTITGFLDMLKARRIEQAEKASTLLSGNECVLTHCNVSGLMPLIGEMCRKQNKDISFFVTETRPYLQGARLTSWELQRAGFDVTVISDTMVAQVMSEDKINSVIVGADHLALNGDFANKIGTYQIALLAKYFEIPLYVLCPPPSHAQTGDDIPIEIRPDKELLEFNGVRIAPRGVKGYYPAFDITPAELVTRHIFLEIR